MSNATAERMPLGDDFDVDPGWICHEPECVNRKPFTTQQGLTLHRQKKHGEEPVYRDGPPKPRPIRITRAKKLEGSLSVLVLGVGILSPAVGGIWTPYVPPIANALDACAAEYKWARTLVDAIENAGPISLLVAALAPPILQTFVHFHLLPPATAQVIGQAGGMSAPPPQPPPQFNQDGSVDMFGIHFSAEDVAAASAFANQQAAAGRTAQSTVTEVPMAG